MDNVRSNPHTDASLRRARKRLPRPGHTASTSAHGAEKRRSVRYSVCADAIIVESVSSTRLTGRAADLSLAGCYLDGINSFPVAASVRLRLTDRSSQLRV